MIKRIFFDLDETLIHTSIYEPEQTHKAFVLDGDLNTYYTIFRPCAKDIIKFARNLVGAENVYILTVATRDYAHEINRLGDFRFPHNQIFSREDLQRHEYPTAYGGCAKLPHDEIADPSNVIIDNQIPRYNEGKISFIGIGKTWETNYLHVRDYFGVNFPDDPFQKNVEEFLLVKMEFNLDLHRDRYYDSGNGSKSQTTLLAEV